MIHATNYEPQDRMPAGNSGSYVKHHKVINNFE